VVFNDFIKNDFIPEGDGPVASGAACLARRGPKVAPPCCGCTCVAHVCVCISYCSVDFEMKPSNHIRNERLGSRLALFDGLAWCLHSLTQECLLQAVLNILGLGFETFNLASAMESRACRATRHDIVYHVELVCDALAVREYFGLASCSKGAKRV
jgi:hypothetical protein